MSTEQFTDLLMCERLLMAEIVLKDFFHHVWAMPEITKGQLVKFYSLIDGKLFKLKVCIYK